MNVKYIPGADPEMLFFDANNKEVKVGIVNVHTGFIQYPLFECQRRFGSFFIRILLQIC